MGLLGLVYLLVICQHPPKQEWQDLWEARTMAHGSWWNGLWLVRPHYRCWCQAGSNENCVFRASSLYYSLEEIIYTIHPIACSKSILWLRKTWIVISLLIFDIISSELCHVWENAKLLQLGSGGHHIAKKPLHIDSVWTVSTCQNIIKIDL